MAVVAPFYMTIIVAYLYINNNRNGCHRCHPHMARKGSVFYTPSEIVRLSSSALLAFPGVPLGASRSVQSMPPGHSRVTLQFMLLMLLCPTPQKAFRSRAQPSRPLAMNVLADVHIVVPHSWPSPEEDRTHGLHLKKIDGLGLQVIENSGGKATTENQRGVDVDAIGLDVRHALR